MAVSRRTLILLSGLTWFLMGCFLLFLGTRFIMRSEVQNPLFLSLGALLVGFFKGRFVLKKSVVRQVSRIVELKSPTLRNIYSPAYYILILSMILLGVLLRYLPFPIYVRGAVDLAIGSALLEGAFLYFRYFATYKIENRVS